MRTPVSEDGRFDLINQPVDKVVKVVALVGPTLKKWSALAGPSAFSRTRFTPWFGAAALAYGSENSVA